MKISDNMKVNFRAAMVLYIFRIIMASIVILPLFVFITGKFANSTLADKFWPLPQGASFFELIWQLKELIPFILPLLFVVIVIYFVLSQLINGGIYESINRNESLNVADFISACGRNFLGFIKIALVGIPVYIISALAIDLVGLFIGKIIGLIAGSGAAAIVNYLIVFVSLYGVAGFFAIMRLILTRKNRSSLRFSFTQTRDILNGKARYFIALNGIAGALTLISFVLAGLMITLPYKLSFSSGVMILTLIIQQAAIFWFGFAEIIQIRINSRFIKEADYGTQME